MTLTRTNIVLAILLLVVIALAAASGVDHSQPNIEFLPDMVRSPAYKAYAPNPNFSDRRTLQTPVPGTIARGELPIHYEPTAEDALRAGEELQNPTDSDSEAGQSSIQRGSEVFRVYCVPCHGGGGAGDGLVAKRGFPPPPSLLTGKSLGMKDGQLFHILTYGQGNMSPLSAQLSRSQRWDVINFVRSLQQQATAKAKSVAPEQTLNSESQPQ